MFDSPLGWKTRKFSRNGVGPTTLIAGNLTRGYFGRASEAQVCRSKDIPIFTRFYNGVWTDDGTNEWLKFAFNKKILLISKKPIVTGMTWIDLYLAGLVYGSDNTGKVVESTPTNQLTIFSINGFQYKVRLMRGYNTNPADVGTGLDSLSEWDGLLKKVVVDASNTSPWDNIPPAEMGFNGLTSGIRNFMMETSVSANHHAVARGGQTFSTKTFLSKAYIWNTMGWRVVLELIPEKPIAAPVRPVVHVETVYPPEVGVTYYQENA